MERSKGCVLCLDWTGSHMRENFLSQIKGRPFANCNVLVGGADCGKRHNHLLHESTAKICNAVVRNRSMSPSRSPNYSAPSKEELEQANTFKNDLLPMQEIMVQGVEQNKACVTFFDSGPNTNLICRAFAESLGLPGFPVTQHLQVTGKQPGEWQTFAYRILLIRKSGEVNNIIPFAIEEITAELPQVDLGPIITLFRSIKLQDIKHPSGHVNLLLGIHEARLFPAQVIQSHDNLLL